VLVDGQKVAYDTPISMLRDDKSYLYKQVGELGPEYVKKLIYMAENKDIDLL